MAEQKSRTENIPLRERRKLLRAFRKQYGITLTKLGNLVGLTNPMLSQFENGKRDLSPDAWSRVLTAIQKLLTEDDARRKQEREKAVKTAGILGIPLTGLLSELSDPKKFREAAGRIALEQEAERKRQLLALENLRSINDPIISELIESFRREIATLEEQLAAAKTPVTSDAEESAD